MTTWLEESFAPAIRRLLAPLDEFLAGLPPPVWKASILAFFLLAAIFACSFRREFIYRGAPDQARWRDLRLWVIAILVPFALVYWIYG